VVPRLEEGEARMANLLLIYVHIVDGCAVVLTEQAVEPVAEDELKFRCGRTDCL
jgi:hypothetical protein